MKNNFYRLRYRIPLVSDLRKYPQRKKRSVKGSQGSSHYAAYGEYYGSEAMAAGSRPVRPTGSVVAGVARPTVQAKPSTLGTQQKPVTPTKKDY